jgi:hypothetical protein
MKHADLDRFGLREGCAGKGKGSHAGSQKRAP